MKNSYIPSRVRHTWESVSDNQLIEFMKDAFCRLFGSLAVHRLLLGLSPDYAQLPVNIFEPVLIAALGLVMVGRLPSGLDLTTYDILLLENTFEGKTKEQIESALCTAVNRLKSI